MTACLLVLLAACAEDAGRTPAATRGESPVLASYEGGRFTAADFAAIVAVMPPRSAGALADPDTKRKFVETQALNAILAAEGRARGYADDPDVARQVRELEDRLVVQRIIRDLEEPPPVSEADLRAAYDANPHLYSGGSVRVRHILVKDEALARRLLAEVRADPTRFEPLAVEHSQDSASKARGGDLGFFGQGRMVAEFEQAAFALAQPGDVSEVVRTPFGYHVIMLTDRRPEEPKPFDEVRDRVRVVLLGQRRQSQLATAYEELKTKARLAIDEQAVAAVPIPPPARGSRPIGGH